MSPTVLLLIQAVYFLEKGRQLRRPGKHQGSIISCSPTRPGGAGHCCPGGQATHPQGPWWQTGCRCPGARRHRHPKVSLCFCLLEQRSCSSRHGDGAVVHRLLPSRAEMLLPSITPTCCC